MRFVAVFMCFLALLLGSAERSEAVTVKCDGISFVNIINNEKECPKSCAEVKDGFLSDHAITPTGKPGTCLPKNICNAMHYPFSSSFSTELNRMVNFCNKSCPKGYTRVETDNTCYKNCNKGIVMDSKGACPAPAATVEAKTVEAKTVTCESPRVLKNGTCACPGASQIFADGKCRAKTCADDNLLNQFGSCVSTCSGGTTLSNANGSCLCPQGANWSDTAKVCSCDRGTTLFNNACVTCKAAKMVDQGGVCTASCGTGKVNQGGVCQDSCDTGKVNQGGVCQDSCTTPQFYPDSEGKCQKNPCNAFGIPDAKGNCQCKQFACKHNGTCIDTKNGLSQNPKDGTCWCGGMGYSFDLESPTLKCSCPAGRYSSAGECRPCSAGTYSEKANSRSCTACPANTYSEGGVKACTPCPAGKSSVSGRSCASCPANQFSPAGGSCQPCPAGTSGGGGDKISCVAAKVAPKVAAEVAAPQICAKGFAKNNKGSCVECPVAHSSDGKGGVCTPCPQNMPFNKTTRGCGPTCVYPNAAPPGASQCFVKCNCRQSKNAYLETHSKACQALKPGWKNPVLISRTSCTQD
jgi:hypothetical protein